MKNIIIINGPNLNLLGKRETSIYGDISFDNYLIELKKSYPDFQIDYYQSNIEGEIIDKLQEVGFSYSGIILNAAAYTHTSVGIADAISAIETPVIEVHISNIYSREEVIKRIITNCIIFYSSLTKHFMIFRFTARRMRLYN